MSRPPISPDKTVAGITVDPQTLERVIPESRRPDGTVRKQIKIRPGFTPQEDVRRFRGTKQAQMDATSLPKGHIVGWAPPPTSTAVSSSNATKPLSKSAKKNAKRKEKREKEKGDTVPDNWDDDDDDDDDQKQASSISDAKEGSGAVKTAVKSSGAGSESKKEAAAEINNADSLAKNLEKLEVK